jgi:MFS family permease
MMMVLNGLLNNIIIPLETKIAKIYSVDGRVVNLANILSFLAYLLVNLPANYLLDKKGIKFGIILGNSIYLLGIVFSCFINAGFGFLIVGYLIFVMGQPFITNIAAKIATYWFFPKNVKYALSLEGLSNFHYGWVQHHWLRNRVCHSDSGGQ